MTAGQSFAERHGVHSAEDWAELRRQLSLALSRVALAEDALAVIESELTGLARLARDTQKGLTHAA